MPTFPMRSSSLARRLAIGAAQIAMIAFPSAAWGTPAAADLQARVDGVIDRAIKAERIVGAVVVVRIDGELVYRRAAGFADRERKRPMRPDTTFRLASITKPIVTAALMRQVELGRLRLDDPVTRWLPSFRPRLADGTAPEISLRQLASHTSGLSYRFLEPDGSAYHRLDISDGMDQPGLDIDENLRRLAEAGLAFRPGEQWRYSLGHDVLGRVLEVATGQSLPALVAETVTGPLRMSATVFVDHQPDRLAVAYSIGKEGPAPIADNMVVSHDYMRARLAPSRAFDATAYASGGAGMVGTADDVMSFLETLRTGGGKILNRASAAEMMRDQVGPHARSQGEGWGFGLGWAVLDDAQAAATPQGKGTLQWGGVYGHNWFIDPANRISVVILTNTAFEGMMGDFPNAVRDAIYGQRGR